MASGVHGLHRSLALGLVCGLTHGVGFGHAGAESIADRACLPLWYGGVVVRADVVGVLS